MSEEMKDCPFCGTKAEFVKDTCEAYVECTNEFCGACSGNFGYHEGDQKKQAITAWNTRQEKEA